MKSIMWFSEISKKDIPLVGGKGANLGEMINNGFPVPNGFCVTSGAYDLFIKKTGIASVIRKNLTGVDVDKTKELNQAAHKIQKIIKDAHMPEDLAGDIRLAYEKLCKTGPEFVAVRSSATAEDLPDASFAGQQVTYLNIKGAENVVKAVKYCFASLFEARAIFYRVQKGFDHFKVKLACPVQKMVQSEISGIMFTVDPVKGDNIKITIESIFGLGEAIVSGSITPDHYEVDKNTFEIIDKNIVNQTWFLAKDQTGKNVHQELKEEKGKIQKLSDDLIKELAKIGANIENHYQFPQDIEWAFQKGKLYVVQSRPVTALKNLRGNPNQIQNHNDQTDQNQDSDDNSSFAEVSEGRQKPILKGATASLGIASGKVIIIYKAEEIDKVEAGDILVTEMTNPNFVPAMKKAGAILTDTGGRTSHAAIVSRELGIPCIVGTGNATTTLKNGDIVTVNGTTGEVFKGQVESENKIEKSAPAPNATFSEEVPITATKVYVNLAEIDMADEVSKLPVDGVGLLRAEFMIAEIGEHPKAMIKDKRESEFIDKLTEGISIIAKAFFPRIVIYRATDFKTNEYRDLKGGKDYEPQESNPMIGYRGAMRYLKDEAVFDLEIQTLKKIYEAGYSNVKLMIPFVRTVSEMEKIIDIIAKSGLRDNKDFKLFMMAEVPSAAILIEKYLELDIDGISIGSNDLTQLVLGVDRDSSDEQLAKEFDERDEAVVWCIKRIISSCKKHGKSVSICGQAPSVYPEICELFVKNGATSVSVNPDVVVATKKLIASVEKKIMLEKDLE